MDFDVFRKTVMDEMRERFPNLEFEFREMKKLQGETWILTMSAPIPVLPSIR